jgi:hypothetical protein
LNMQMGTDIVFWHRLEMGNYGRQGGASDLELQVIGRVNRMGVKEPPTVHRIAYQGEYAQV